MLFIIIIRAMNYARLCMHSWSQKLVPFPSLPFTQIGAQYLLPAKPDLTLPSCFTESTCCRETLYTGGRNSFLQSHASRQAGRKEASRQSEGGEAMVMVAGSITPTIVSGRTLRTPSDWVSSQDCCSQKVDSMAIGGMKIPDVPAASGRLRFSRQTKKVWAAPIPDV